MKGLIIAIVLLLGSVAFAFPGITVFENAGPARFWDGNCILHVDENGVREECQEFCNFTCYWSNYTIVCNGELCWNEAQIYCITDNEPHCIPHSVNYQPFTC